MEVDDKAEIWQKGDVAARRKIDASCKGRKGWYQTKCVIRKKEVGS